MWLVLIYNTLKFWMLVRSKSALPLFVTRENFGNKCSIERKRWLEHGFIIFSFFALQNLFGFFFFSFFHKKWYDLIVWFNRDGNIFFLIQSWAVSRSHQAEISLHFAADLRSSFELKGYWEFQIVYFYLFGLHTLSI